MKPTIWIFSLEPMETRYTAQWHQHFPKLMLDNLGDKFNVVQIDGIQKNSNPTPGAFLNFSDTNYWKSSQLCNFLEHHNNGKTTANDHFIFTDAWNPSILQLKYMSSLLGIDIKIHALWHAGSYDPQDFLGRLIGDAAWVRHTEKAFFHAIDYNYFATEFHIDMFMENLLKVDESTGRARYVNKGKICRSGWPMDYLKSTVTSGVKRDLILFPHRIAPEKQVEIFRDLASQLPEYEFVVCQDQQLTKEDYHKLLSEAKMVFSANLQETLGISCYEGMLAGAVPIVPDRLSYREMYYDLFKYDSHWTSSYKEYEHNRERLKNFIRMHMKNYDSNLDVLNKNTERLTNEYFSANKLLDNIDKT